jgi:hypothetical protein
MKKLILLIIGLIGSNVLHADTFGTGAKQFTIDFTQERHCKK